MEAGREYPKKITSGHNNKKTIFKDVSCLSNDLDYSTKKGFCGPCKQGEVLKWEKF